MDHGRELALDAAVPGRRGFARDSAGLQSGNGCGGELESFELECRGVGAFPAPDRPRTLWIGAGKGSQAMIALQAAIQSRLDRLGFRGEARRYVPHLTLGRAGRNSPPRALVRELASLAEYDAGVDARR